MLDANIAVPCTVPCTVPCPDPWTPVDARTAIDVSEWIGSTASRRWATGLARALPRAALLMTMDTYTHTYVHGHGWAGG